MIDNSILQDKRSAHLEPNDHCKSDNNRISTWMSVILAIEIKMSWICDYNK